MKLGCQVCLFSKRWMSLGASIGLWAPKQLRSGTVTCKLHVFG